MPFAVVADLLRPANFFVGPPARLEWQGPVAEEVPWEVFQGRLLDRAHTRLRRPFMAWNVFWVDETGRSAEPIISVKLDAAVQLLHVVRAVHCYAWEGYDAGGNVYLSRETTKWIRELVGTIALDRTSQEGLRRELAGLLTRAVVGTSRLPLTSVESPLPAFSLGRLAYFPQRAGITGPVTSWRDVLSHGAGAPGTWAEESRLLEIVLRAVAPAELDEAASVFAGRWTAHGLGPRGVARLFRSLFNEVALSPYTAFVDNALALVPALVRLGQLGASEEVDFLGWLLRQLGRHLTAYDLVTFHHRGANYPDALLLDAALRHYLRLAEAGPDLFTTTAADGGAEQTRKRLRRRALRQGWLLRRRYEGHPVPDAPTSPGECARVLPPPHVRVPEEQILQPARRHRRLFAEGPLDRHLGEGARVLLRESVRELDNPEELRELGLAVFIDRPLGVFKHPLEPDLTLLLACEAFSRSVAEARLGLLPTPDERDRFCRALRELSVAGLPLSAVQCEEGRIASLADVRRAADDFLLLRTTRQGVADFLAQYDLAPLAGRFSFPFLAQDRQALIVPSPAAAGADERVLAVYDLRLRKRLELGFRRGQGYEARAGAEYPRGGLQVLRVWEAAGGEQALRERDLRDEGITLRPAAGSPGELAAERDASARPS
jgi:hypothetical protein